MVYQIRLALASRCSSFALVSQHGRTLASEIAILEANSRHTDCDTYSHGLASSRPLDFDTYSHDFKAILEASSKHRDPKNIITIHVPGGPPYMAKTYCTAYCIRTTTSNSHIYILYGIHNALYAFSFGPVTCHPRGLKWHLRGFWPGPRARAPAPGPGPRAP